MSRTLMPDGIAAASVSQYSFLFPVVFAMDGSETCSDLELLGFRLLLCPTFGACDHPGVVLCFIIGAVVPFIAFPAAASLRDLSLPSDRCSYCYPGNTEDDFITFVLLTLPDVQRVAFRL